MDGSAFEDHGFDYSSNQPLPSLNSTLLQKNHHQDNAHSIQTMLGLQLQQQDVFAGMEYKTSTQKLDGSPMHHDLGPLFQHPGMEVINPGVNGMKRKNEDIVLIQSQQLTSTELPTTTTSGGKKNDKKKNDNNGVKKKKTR